MSPVVSGLHRVSENSEKLLHLSIQRTGARCGQWSWSHMRLTVYDRYAYVQVKERPYDRALNTQNVESFFIKAFPTSS